MNDILSLAALTEELMTKLVERRAELPAVFVGLHACMTDISPPQAELKLFLDQHHEVLKDEVIQAGGGQTATQARRSVSRLPLSLAVDRALDALVEATEASPLLAVITQTGEFAYSRAWSVLLQAAKSVLLCNKPPKGTGGVTAFLKAARGLNSSRECVACLKPLGGRAAQLACLSAGGEHAEEDGEEDTHEFGDAAGATVATGLGSSTSRW